MEGENEEWVSMSCFVTFLFFFITFFFLGEMVGGLGLGLDVAVAVVVFVVDVAIAVAVFFFVAVFGDRSFFNDLR